MTETLDLTLSTRVQQLCAKNPDYEILLRTIIQVDRLYENDKFGWQFADCQGLAGAHIPVLMQNGILRYGYKSNSATHYRLAMPADELECLLDDIELTRLEIEKEKLQSMKSTEMQTSVDPEMVNYHQTSLAGFPRPSRRTLWHNICQNRKGMLWVLL